MKIFANIYVDHLTNYFEPLDQLFDQLLQLDQLNRPLYDAGNIVGGIPLMQVILWAASPIAGNIVVSIP